MKKLNVLVFLGAVATLSSCLKAGKENFPSTSGASPATVEWSTAQLDDAPQNSASNIYREYSRTLAIGSSIAMNLQVDLTGTDAAASDITVTIAVNPTAASTYNTTYGTTNPLLPASIYTLPTTVVIAKGTRDATVPIIVNTASASFNLANVYMLPLSITATTFGQVAANYGTVIYLVNAKNAYEADYTCTGYIFHPTAPRAVSATLHMSSGGLTTNSIGFGDLASSVYIFQYTFPAAGGALTTYNALSSMPAPPQSGFMTADNPGGIVFPAGADQPGTAPWVQSTYNNSFDGSKTFYFHVGYASGGNGQNTWSRQLYQKAVRAN